MRVRFSGLSPTRSPVLPPLRVYMVCASFHQDIEDFPPEIAALIKQITEATLSSDGKALAEAVRRGQVDQVRAIVARSPGVLLESDLLGVTPMMHAAKRYSEQHVEIIQLLLDRGCDVNASTINGWTALHAASTLEVGGPRMIRFLVKNGATLGLSGLPHASSIHGTPLHVAVRRGTLKNARLLVELGCNPGVRSYSGSTAVEEAKPERYRLAAAKVIEDASANRERRQLMRRLHLACLVEEEDKCVLHALARRQVQRRSLPTLRLLSCSHQQKKLRSSRDLSLTLGLMSSVVHRLDSGVRQHMLSFV